MRKFILISMLISLSSCNALKTFLGDGNVPEDFFQEGDVSETYTFFGCDTNYHCVFDSRFEKVTRFYNGTQGANVRYETDGEGRVYVKDSSSLNYFKLRDKSYTSLGQSVGANIVSNGSGKIYFSDFDGPDNIWSYNKSSFNESTSTYTNVYSLSYDKKTETLFICNNSAQLEEVNKSSLDTNGVIDPVTDTNGDSEVSVICNSNNEYSTFDGQYIFAETGAGSINHYYFATGHLDESQSHGATSP
jgi:hypothetical protein